ncbi:MAG: pilus assembly FimT family protein [Halorhabdus sp.]
MTILVKSDPTAGQRSGDWVVATSGGKTISRHRLKSQATEQARAEAKKRGTDLRVQDTGGRWSQGPSY